MSERKVPITSLLSVSDVEKLDALSKSEDKSVSALIRQAVAEFLQRKTEEAA